MRIYLMRHADAVAPGEWRDSDRSRPLSTIGASLLSNSIEDMRRLRLTADTLLTSPFLRAEQTAAALSDQLHITQTVRCPELASGARLPAFLALVARYQKAESLWIVAHMPEICSFAARLTGDPKALETPFDPAEMIAADCDVVDGELKTGRLVWRRRLEDWLTASA